MIENVERIMKLNVLQCTGDYITIESTEYDRQCRKDYETKCNTVYRLFK